MAEHRQVAGEVRELLLEPDEHEHIVLKGVASGRVGLCSDLDSEEGKSGDLGWQQERLFAELHCDLEGVPVPIERD